MSTFSYALLLIASFWAVTVNATLLPSNTESPEQGFQAYYDQVFQIRVISPRAGSKSSIGSGFQVSADGLLITNYHVISAFVQNPASHRIEYRSHTGGKGELSLLDFDVVNDLALLQLDTPSDQFLPLSEVPLAKGEVVYALGNPRDYGTSLVQGPNNGLVEHSYTDQIFFSGSLNPGMSGGPALDRQGSVVGVNVATAGSQLSFLVPVTAVSSLLSGRRTLDQSSYQAEISDQIKRWQRPRIQQLIERDWEVESFAGRPLFGELRRDFQCWGRTNEDTQDRAVANASKTCEAGNSLFLDSRLYAGDIHFSFDQSRSIKLNRFQFTRGKQTLMHANNASSYEHSTNFECHVDFVQSPTAKEQNGFSRVTTCIRGFKQLSGLYDSLLLLEHINGSQSFAAHLSLSAVEQDQIMAMNQKFLERTL